MKVSHFSLAAAVAIAAAGTASAGTVIAKLNSVNPSASATVNVVSGVFSGSTTAGQLNWTRTGGDHVGTPTGSFSTFCIELNQNVGFSTYTYDVISLADAPNPGTPLPGASGMGATKAADIKKLWAEYYDDAILSGTNAAAFQLAVWEIVYEGTATAFTSYDLDAGDLTGGAGAIKSTAETWLNSLGGLTKQANLAALSSLTAQDQLVLVPLPTAAWMGLGLLASAAGVSYARRRSILA